jgi:predicted phosphate transport protein (TIGR00153 family)
MLTIAKLFGKSPFAPLRSHMDKVAACMALLPELLEPLKHYQPERLAELTKKISKLEHEADLTKNDIRNHLPTSLFMPIPRFHFLEILSLQDSLADQAENIARISILTPLETYAVLETKFTQFWEYNLQAFLDVFAITKHLDELLESSFGGIKAQKVNKMIEKVALQEHKADILQMELLQQLYRSGKEQSYVSFHLWITLLKEVSMISNISEKLANRIRMILEIK